MSGSVQSLAGVDTVLLDSHAALKYARASRMKDSARVYSFSPALTNEPSIIPLENVADSALIRSLFFTFCTVGRRLYEVVSENQRWSERALTIARLVPSTELLAYKAVVLARSIGNPQGIAAVEPPLPKGHSFVAPWEELLEEVPTFQGILTVPKERFPYVSVTEEPNASLITRLRFEGWESIAYRGVTRLSRLAKPFLRRGDILVPSENSLIKEACWWLTCMGYRPVSVPKKRFVPERLALEEEQSLRALIGPVFRECLAPSIGEASNEWFLAAFIGRTSRALAQYQQAMDHWRGVFNTRFAGKPRAIVTNYNAKPDGEALYDLCSHLNVAHVAVEHGTGIGYSPIFEETPYASEIATCDLYLTYNDKEAGLLRNNPFRRGTPKSVGLPRDLAFVAHRDTDVKITPPICYISCQALMGNVMRPIAGGVTEQKSVAWEIEIIEEVLSRLPHRVMFKPYRAVRYPDGNPIHAAARNCDNIEVFEDRIDLRYLLSRPRLLIVNHAGSTVSWCLLSRRPVVFLDSEDQSPLYPDVREAIKQGTFWFDADAPQFTARLRQFLSRPIEHIEKEWKERIPARDRFIERFIGNPDGQAGRRRPQLLSRS